MPEVVHKCGTTSEITDEEGEEAGDTWFTDVAGGQTGTITQVRIGVATDDGHGLLGVGLFKGGDGSLGALGAALEVLGIFAGPVIKVVRTLPEGLVALLEAHDKGGKDGDLSNLEVG